jgi:hypothetical protein
VCLALGVVVVVACGGDDDGTEADRYGVGAECRVDDDCLQSEDDSEPVQRCLMQFKGGYCGVADCTGDDDCPSGSACVAHTDGDNYCFRICVDKGECNRNRGPEVESNCSSNITFVDDSNQGKACVPPSS